MIKRNSLRAGRDGNVLTKRLFCCEKKRPEHFKYLQTDTAKWSATVETDYLSITALMDGSDGMTYWLVVNMHKTISVFNTYVNIIWQRMLSALKPLTLVFIALLFCSRFILFLLFGFWQRGELCSKKRQISKTSWQHNRVWHRLNPVQTTTFPFQWAVLPFLFYKLLMKGQNSR